MRRRRQGGIHNVSIDGLAGCIWPLAAISRPRHQGIRGVSSHRAVAVHLASGRTGDAEQTVPGKEQFLSLLGRLSPPPRQRSRRAKSDARAAGASLRDAQVRRLFALPLTRTPPFLLPLPLHPPALPTTPP